MPVVPATGDAEAGGYLEPGNLRLAWLTSGFLKKISVRGRELLETLRGCQEGPVGQITGLNYYKTKRPQQDGYHAGEEGLHFEGPGE
jgi:hypothetical protein